MSGLFGSESWLYIILVGFVVGLLARLITPHSARMGCLLTIGLGIVGAVLAGWFGRRMGWYAAGEPAGFFGALLGAVVILGLTSLFTRR
ncbi:GlsB/YeaQ/YmgE family stress response membrane protein [Pseudoxanthomonas winnipegensis]|uniref:GlsB/YeaQ/YmgE family stress response membrane protein n=1 Tax=Pseudoxanthomonas winnipegensis TaxID=2480810 RepID=UPI002575D900|nr:GlsB/YeaQ/YmgE family stress response membrane protein [Pseudoxanthomonas winnipegensis]WJI14490.1 GlsB/YeaQ/YmgE family stress response membrane protein [Pseudoxanthomonas winnipegensis]